MNLFKKKIVFWNVNKDERYSTINNLYFNHKNSFMQCHIYTGKTSQNGHDGCLQPATFTS